MPLVFAYGSNMDPEHLDDFIQGWQNQNRGQICTVISARRARLPGYRLCWNYRRSDGTGASNITEDAQHHLWGVLLDVTNLTAIDHKEGYKPTNVTASHYLRFEKQVILDDGGTPTANVYIARETENIHVSPTKAYKDLVLKGAIHFNLPQDYRTAISMVQTREQEIELMAYFRWLNSGATHGHDWEDWFASELTLNAVPRVCVYCLVPKRFYKSSTPVNDFNVEHVVHHAFGRCKNNNPTLVGRVCKDCNQEFSRSIDIAATKGSYEAYLRAQHGLKDPAELSGQEQRRLSVRYKSSNGETGSLPIEPAPRNSGSALTARPIIKLQRRSDASVECLDEYQLAGMSREELLNQYDLTKEVHFIGPEASARRLQGVLEQKVQATAQEIGGSAIPSAHQEIIVDETLQRAYSKIAFNYFVYACEDKCPELPYHNCFDDARLSILRGVEPAWGRIANPWNVPDLPTVAGIFGNAGHLVMLEYGLNEGDEICLIGKVVLFSGYGYRVALSRNCEYKRELEQAHFWDMVTNDLIAVDPAIHNALRGM